MKAKHMIHPVVPEAQTVLNNFIRENPHLAASLEGLSALLQSEADPFSRKNMKGHITTSALIVSPDGRQCLMIHHNVFDRLMQPGGHHEGYQTLIDSARREGLEETSVIGLIDHPWTTSSSRAFDIDSHPIAANAKKNEGDHVHHDVLFLMQADPSQPLKPQLEEVRRVDWFDTEQLMNFGSQRLERLYAKLVSEGISPQPAKALHP